MGVEEGMTHYTYFFYLVEPRNKHTEGTSKYNTQEQQKVKTPLQNKTNKLIKASKGEATSKLHLTGFTPVKSC
jgi:hypothetical protein